MLEKSTPTPFYLHFTAINQLIRQRAHAGGSHGLRCSGHERPLMPHGLAHRMVIKHIAKAADIDVQKTPRRLRQLCLYLLGNLVVEHAQCLVGRQDKIHDASPESRARIDENHIGQLTA